MYEAKPIWNPFGYRSSSDTRKLSGATFTRISSFPKCLMVYYTTLFASLGCDITYKTSSL